MSMNFPRISLSSSVECKEKELPYIDENVKTQEEKSQRNKGKHKTKTLKRNSQSYTTSQGVHKHSQKQLMNRWMGLARFAYNSVVKWSKRCYFTKEDGIKKKKYINPMNHQQKLSLFSDIRAGINVDKVSDKKLINSAIWGERKFLNATT